MPFQRYALRGVRLYICLERLDTEYLELNRWSRTVALWRRLRIREALPASRMTLAVSQSLIDDRCNGKNVIASIMGEGRREERRGGGNILALLILT